MADGDLSKMRQLISSGTCGYQWNDFLESIDESYIVAFYVLDRLPNGTVGKANHILIIFFAC
jgi:hypothetical protein